MALLIPSTWYSLSSLPALLASRLSPRVLANIAFVSISSVLFITLHAAAVDAVQSTHFLASSVVACTELLKLVLSFGLSFYFDGHLDPRQFLDALVRAFVDDGLDVLKLCLPAMLYTIQNNLQYIIESAPLFLVLYQSKIVTTAIFFTIMLSKRLSIKEWCAILTLAIGVSIVESSQHEISPHHASSLVGMVSVLTACLTSGFAGVYFEKVLKASRTSIWILNVQLSMMSCSFSMMFAMVLDPEAIIEKGLFQGFNGVVFVILIIQAVTGLALALVVKYSDNLYKGFGNSIAIVIADFAIGVCYHDVTLNARFAIGSLLVLLSSAAYYAMTATQAPHSDERVGGKHSGPTAGTSSSVPTSSANHAPSAYVVLNSGTLKRDQSEVDLGGAFYHQQV